MNQDLWAVAKQLHQELAGVWTGDAEIYFAEPEGDDSCICYISEELSNVMSKAPDIESRLLESFSRHLESLQGHSVCVHDGHVSLREGSSDDFLAAWSLLGKQSC